MSHGSFPSFLWLCLIPRPEEAWESEFNSYVSPPSLPFPSPLLLGRRLVMAGNSAAGGPCQTPRSQQECLLHRTASCQRSSAQRRVGWRRTSGRWKGGWSIETSIKLEAYMYYAITASALQSCERRQPSHSTAAFTQHSFQFDNLYATCPIATVSFLGTEF